MGELASNSQWHVISAIVAAAALSCTVGWLVDGGFAWLRQTCQRWLAGVRARPTSPRATQPGDPTTWEFGDEFVRALTLAINTYTEPASDEQAIIDAIVTQLGWSPTRARWFFAVNRDQVERAADERRQNAANAEFPRSA